MNQKLGRYDPPDKVRMLEENPCVSTLGDLLMRSEATMKALMEKMKELEAASRAKEAGHAPDLKFRPGRRPVVTAERIKKICDAVAGGDTEQEACLKTGISIAAWCNAKRKDCALRERVQLAHAIWAQDRYERHMGEKYASQLTRAAGHKAKRPEPVRQAKLVVWYLTFRVPLNVVAIFPKELAEACKQFNFPFERWQRQCSAFNLMQKVYERRAQLRGERTGDANLPPSFEGASEEGDDTSYPAGTFAG